jgi:hypothetical protein
MATNAPGYVYILTNPSFREDWVKIGKSSRPVNVRSKELDNTSVPLPFEIFATMKTAKYNAAPPTEVKEKDLTIEDMAGKISIILNGKVSYQSRLGFDVVKEYLNLHLDNTMLSLKKIFNDNLLGDWNQWKMLEENIEYAKRLKDLTGSYRHQVKRQFILRSGDGIKFVVSNQWSIVNVMNLIRFIKDICEKKC